MEKWNYLHRSLLYFHPSVDIIELFIKLGIDVNAQDIYGMTPLHYAMRGKNVDAAIALLNAGADPNIPNIDNLIPLRMCIRYPDRLDLLALMLQNGGDVHYFNGQDYLLEGLKDFKGDDPNYSAFFEMMEKYA
ncbi:Ankyrin repeat [Rodentibacter pneumotropicus]|uniref:Ankyrin repeat n=2 Tax=Rodentibacter pneumotropicus TaxID=758 RepID=A0A448MQW7_9PAST|nr:Ankyrin repeat [Rodentibacter pneumotropicus]